MKILVRLPNWLGDLVMSTAFITAVRQVYPESVIDVIVKQELKSIASLLPGISQIFPFSKQEFKGLNGVFKFGKKLRIEKYDLFFCLPDSLSSAVMGWATGAKKRVGFNKEGRFFLLTNNYKKPGKLHRTDEYVNLLEQFSGRNITNRIVSLILDPPSKDKNIVVVNFNSEATSRKMPLLKGKQIVGSLMSNFPDTIWVFVGSGKEKEHVDSILSGYGNSDNIINYAGKTNLHELCNLFLSARAVLTTDSGPAHLANGLGTPTIVLFGAGDEFNTAPYNKHNLMVVRSGQLDCEPCVRNTCQLYGIPKCMELIDETQIINALRNYL